MNHLDYEKNDQHTQFLEQINNFTGSLLSELLAERCDPESGFRLPGLPVTDGELLGALTGEGIYAQASPSLKKMWAELLQELLAEEVDTAAPPMVQLRWLYGLKHIWVLAIVLAFAYSSDPKYEKAFLLLQGDSGRKGPDVFLTHAIAVYLGMESEGVQLLAESRAKTDLFEESDKGELLLRRNVLLWLYRQEENSRSLQDVYQIHSASENMADIRRAERKWCSALAERQLTEGVEDPLVFVLQGRKGAGKTAFCSSVAAALGYQLCSVRLASLMERPAGKSHQLLSEIFFACRVNGCLPYLDLTDCGENCIHLAKKFAAEYTLLFIGADPDSLFPEKLALSAQKISLDRLTMEDSLCMWQWASNPYELESSIDFEQLAGKYRLLPAAICEVLVRAERKQRESGKPCIDFPLLLSCIRECNQFTGNPLMERIETVFRWEDLKVEPQVIHGMQLACAHLKYRFTMQKTIGEKYPYGRGVGVLMYGPPGTGKTMAAQVIANELQMDLCRVDLSQVSSKYIGETEKNLERIFREAEQSNVILFFDEADAMFGKRTEVKDSNDKYANQETSYILQRIESYEGMVILATNFSQNFDNAFMRRITISIRFSLPDEAMRKLLWQDMLQSTALADDTMTIGKLAEQFELSGSNIKNIVRNAVFLALMEDHPMEIGDIAKAAKIEYEKLGKIANASSFGMFFSYIT